MKRKIFVIILSLLAFLIVLSGAGFLGWLFKPKKELDIFILDKTVPTKERREHKSLHWVLNHERFVKPNKKRYNLSKDYFGFYPLSSEKEEFNFKSLAMADLKPLAKSVDLAYYTDTYGVYYKDWYSNKSPKLKPRQKVYGGLNQTDYLFLKELKERDKTIITEFVMLGEPTSGLVREKTEALFKLKWRGWVGKYFQSLDTSKTGPAAVPNWIVKLYMNRHNERWDFDEGGLVLVHKYGKVIILEDHNELNGKAPQIKTDSVFCKKYNLPAEIPYHNWFDVVLNKGDNNVPAVFDTNPTQKGDSLLKANGLKASFPAIIHKEDDYNFFYFAGDFSDNPVKTWYSNFEGIRKINSILCTAENNSPKAFFWHYYVPLVDKILNDTYDKKMKFKN